MKLLVSKHINVGNVSESEIVHCQVGFHIQGISLGKLVHKSRIIYKLRKTKDKDTNGANRHL